MRLYCSPTTSPEKSNKNEFALVNPGTLQKYSHLEKKCGKAEPQRKEAYHEHA